MRCRLVVPRLCFGLSRNWRGVLVALGMFLAVLTLPGVSFAQRECWTLNASNQPATTIFNINPQVAIPEVTWVYIVGSCFGDSQGSVKINGVPASNIFLWSDGEIVFQVPLGAQNGVLEVDSLNYGSDTSANEGPSAPYSFMGNGQVNANFTVVTPNVPSFYGPPPKIDLAGAWAPMYVEGSWNYDDGLGDQATYTLSQSSLNNGTWPVSGSVTWTYYADPSDTCTQSVTGTLGAAGSLILYVADDLSEGCGAYQEQYVLLNSGDATSQGLFMGWGGTFPLSNFPNDLGDWYDPDVPLLKSHTDLPNTESPSFLTWVTINPDLDKTYGAWQRTLPQSSDGFVEFSGRFVYEQSATGTFDGCWNGAAGNSPYPQLTGVSGGAWYVNTSGVWGSGNLRSGSNDPLLSDDIGIDSDRVKWYQRNVHSCTITVHQEMLIDSVNGPVAYNTDQFGTTNQHEIDIDSSLSSPLYCTGVIPNGGSLVPMCQQYPPQ
jgi:hypothetical protein